MRNGKLLMKSLRLLNRIKKNSMINLRNTDKK